MLVTVGVGGYVLYKLLSKAADKPTTAVANAYTDITDWLNGRTGTTVAGAAVLPNGQLVPLTSMSISPGPNATAFAVYGGVRYQLAAHDANGNYPATPV